MCIIILDNRETADHVEKVQLERAVEKNPHGMGLMWPGGKQVNTWTSMDNLDELWERYVALRGDKLPVAIHFRKATLGEEGLLENCHPFKIRPSLAFMHNGTIKALESDLPEKTSDSRYINTEFLQKLPANFLQRPACRLAVTNLVEAGRLLFMDAKGDVTILNKDRWGARWDNGVWYSKSQHLEYYLKGTYVFDGVASGSHTVDFTKLREQVAAPTYIGPTTVPAKVIASKYGIKNNEAGNLVFDYGFMGRFGWWDDRIRRVTTAVVTGYQLWGIGPAGQEEPAALSNRQTAIRGALYRINSDVLDVLGDLDDIHSYKQGSDAKDMPYRRDFVQVDLGKGKAWAWMYRRAYSLHDLDAAPCRDGDWRSWNNNVPPMTSFGTLSVKRVSTSDVYPCPMCASLSTVLSQMWADRKDYGITCATCGGDSLIIERG